MIRQAKVAVWRLRRWFRPFQVFANRRDFRRALRVRDDGETVIRTRSGLKIAVRHNYYDANIVHEQFIDKYYVAKFRPPAGRPPVVVDVGSYIGDFALYCAHELGARVVAYEPTAENFVMLQKNLALNPHLTGRVTAVNRGVASTPELVANVQVLGREVHVSSDWYADDPAAEKRSFPCDTLTEVLDKNGLDRVDLLKVDCEGGEYDIFPATPKSTYDRIGSIVYEWHTTPNWEKRREVMEAALRDAGFTVTRSGEIGFATRA